MRRAIALFLAVYTVILSCIPCMDACCREDDGEETITVLHNAGKECPPHSNICSPFTPCGCCVGFAIPQSYRLELRAAMPPAKPLFGVYSLQAAAEVSLPIWQPPQLV